MMGVRRDKMEAIRKDFIVSEWIVQIAIDGDDQVRTLLMKCASRKGLMD